MRKIACLFPGIGYTCDKPLLYYSWKLLQGSGWEIAPVQYSGFPTGVKGNPEKMRQSALMALEQAEEILKDIRWEEYSDILLIGKSVGTVVCAAYARQHHLACRQILFTPVEATFDYVDQPAIVFHGTADPWADTGVIEEKCAKMGIPIHETAGANHSLETGNVDADLRIMRETMSIVREYAGAGKQEAGMNS